MLNVTHPPSSQHQMSCSMPSPHAIPDRRGDRNDTSPLLPLLEMDEEEASDPDGQKSPNRSEKLSSEPKWDNHDQGSPVAPMDKGKNKAVPQFSVSNDIQMDEPIDSPPWR